MASTSTWDLPRVHPGASPESSRRVISSSLQAVRHHLGVVHRGEDRDDEDEHGGVDHEGEVQVRVGRSDGGDVPLGLVDPEPLVEAASASSPATPAAGSTCGFTLLPLVSSCSMLNCCFSTRGQLPVGMR